MKGQECSHCAGGPTTDPVVLIILVVLGLMIIASAVGAIFAYHTHLINKEVKEVFCMFDVDGSGAIDIEELQGALQKLCDAGVNREDVRDLFDIIDLDCSGTIDLDEFTLMMTDKGHETTRQRLQLIRDAGPPPSKGEDHEETIDKHLATTMSLSQNAAINSDLAQLSANAGDMMNEGVDSGGVEDDAEAEDGEEEELLQEALAEELGVDEESVVEFEGSEVEVEGDDGSTQEALEDLQAQCKIITSHLQVMSNFKASISITWPSIFGQVCAFCAIFNIDLVAVLGLDCVAALGFYTKLVQTFLLPLAALGLVGILYTMMVFAEAKADEGTAATWAWKKVMLTTFFFYPGTSQVMLQTFKCREIDGQHYLEADLTELCYTNEWSAHAVVAVMGLLTFSLGVPLFNYLLLQRNRHKLFTGEKFHDRFGFIYIRYEAAYFWFELCEMLRKVCCRFCSNT
jgi:Ca2+-binding EF-hand superfamily protein